MLLAGLLAISIAAALGVSRQEETLEVSEAVTRELRQKPLPDAQVGEVKNLGVLARSPITAGEHNPFAPKSWYVAPPLPMAAKEEVTQPAAPPLPFTYKGKLGGGGTAELFYLADGKESYVVSVGDTFAEAYKLEGVRDGTLTIRYLPLSTIQTLHYGIEQ